MLCNVKFFCGVGVVFGTTASMDILILFVGWAGVVAEGRCCFFAFFSSGFGIEAAQLFSESAHASLDELRGVLEVGVS